MKYFPNSAFDERVGQIARETGFRLYDTVLVENGRFSRYVHSPANMCNDSYSVAKAFTMTAIGMLVSLGRLSVDEKICDILRRRIVWSYNEAWERVTVRDALLHRMGLGEGYLDIDCDDVSEYPSKDYLALTLKRPLPHEPGTVEVYSDAAFYLLSRVVTEISGEKLDDFLMSRLFNPLDFSETAWSKCPRGYAIGATGLYIRTEDMAKLGLVYLDGGVWRGRRVFPAEWARTAIRERYELYPCGAKSFGKGGMCGQMVAFCPDTRRVVAWHAFDTSSSDFGERMLREVLEK